MTKYFAFILECIYLTVYQKKKTCLRADARRGQEKKKRMQGPNREGGFVFWMGKGKVGKVRDFISPVQNADS